MEKKAILKYVLIGSLVIGLLLSSYFSISYYYSSEALTRRIQGATLENAEGFWLSLNYATYALETLESEAKRANASISDEVRAVARENARTAIRHFGWHIGSARYFLYTFRVYLFPSYEDALLIVEHLLWDMSVTGRGGLRDALEHLMSRWSTDISMVANAFEEINLLASDKINEMGLELAESFAHTSRRDGVVYFFEVDHSRLENTILIANELGAIFDELVAEHA